MSVHFTIETELEDDGRWIAEVLEMPGVLAYGQTQTEAKAKVQALAFRVLAEQLENGETTSDLMSVQFEAA
ncbi:MAG: type II toxin-antitoxin system HicB family antitoxin [Blastocatellia bacterium]|nr:type II toxin-antitoxin system HicB family antitoxin [Blastocatellia bacterium]